MPEPENVQYFPTDFQYLNKSNRKLLRDEVVSYIDGQILAKEERDDLISKYDTFKIEAASRRTLKELISGFQD